MLADELRVELAAQFFKLYISLSYVHHVPVCMRPVMRVLL